MNRSTLVALCAMAPTSLCGQAKTPPTSRPAPKHLLRYALHKGAKGEFELRNDSLVKTGKEEPTLRSEFAHCRWTVLAVDAKWAHVEIRFLERGVRKSEKGKFVAMADSEPIRFHLNARGQLRLKPKSERKAREVRLIRTIIRELPALPVAVGDQWTARTEALIQKKRMQMSIRNTVRSFEKGHLRFHFDVTYSRTQTEVKIVSLGPRGQADCGLGQFIPKTLLHPTATEVKLGGIVLLSSDRVVQVGPVGSLRKAKLPQALLTKLHPPKPKKASEAEPKKASEAEPKKDI